MLDLSKLYLKHLGLYKIDYTVGDVDFRDIEAKWNYHGKFFYLNNNFLQQVDSACISKVTPVLLESKPYLPKGKKFQQRTIGCIAGEHRNHTKTKYGKGD